MLIKEWLCNLSKNILLKAICTSLDQLLLRGTHLETLKGKNFHTNLKCAWKGKGLKLLTPITSNKNKHKSNKNLEVMTRVIKAQLLG
jgi:hypothetical protein